MSVGQHTPGEWKAEAGILKGGNILIRSGDYAIAKVYNQEPGSEATNAANARLIVAAQDLLKAALFAWRRLDLTGDDSEAADKLYAAIARATGAA